MAVTVTNSTILAFNTVAALTQNLATADTDALAEVFTITPTKTCTRCIIVVSGTGSAADGDISYSIAAGGAFWASKALTGTVTKNTRVMIEVETANVLKADGTIALTLTPAATDKLKTDHSAYVEFVQLR